MQCFLDLNENFKCSVDEKSPIFLKSQLVPQFETKTLAQILV